MLSERIENRTPAIAAAFGVLSFVLVKLSLFGSTRLLTGSHPVSDRLVFLPKPVP